VRSAKEWASFYFDGRLNFTFDELVDMCEAVQRDARLDYDAACRAFGVRALRVAMEAPFTWHRCASLIEQIERGEWPPIAKGKP